MLNQYHAHNLRALTALRALTQPVATPQPYDRRT